MGQRGATPDQFNSIIQGQNIFPFFSSQLTSNVSGNEIVFGLLYDNKPVMIAKPKNSSQDPFLIFSDNDRDENNFSKAIKLIYTQEGYLISATDTSKFVYASTDDENLYFGEFRSDPSLVYVFYISFVQDVKGFDLLYSSGETFTVVPNSNTGFSLDQLNEGINFIGTSEFVITYNSSVFKIVYYKSDNIGKLTDDEFKRIAGYLIVRD
jgi:hypothetical protein